MDECFQAQSGQYAVVCGEEEFTANPGDFVFLPRGLPHGYVAGAEGGAMLILGIPAGLESFFGDMFDGVPLEELGRRHHITFL